ncbi:hypothetical protein LWI29_009189 [Acer saccharum]|uniref:Retrotransposon Copia-like N-terminal domain-containing protein n=1 Tax=Acer saccharum TaxID=4024 RepID=A0AA39TMV2_ACESA|nr:hypothetical protein LWI29_009189 [Acer saccharum]
MAGTTFFPSSSSSTPSLPSPTLSNFLKLTESNYLLWTAQLRLFLIGHNLYHYVDGTAPAPPSCFLPPLMPSLILHQFPILTISSGFNKTLCVCATVCITMLMALLLLLHHASCYH